MEGKKRKVKDQRTEIIIARRISNFLHQRDLQETAYGLILYRCFFFRLGMKKVVECLGV